jgi:PAS domain S-box-containing protein
VVIAWRARRTRDRSLRLAWYLLSGSSAAFVVGVLISIGYLVVLQIELPFPSPADVAFVVDDVLAPLGVLFLASRTLGSTRVRLFLDGAIVASALLLLSWLTTLHAVYTAHGGNPLSFAVGLVYPVSDVINAVIVVATLSHSRRLDPRLVLVGLAMLCFTISDTLFANLGYQHPSVMDAGEVAGQLLLCFAALADGGAPETGAAASPARWQMALPYVPMLAASLLVLGNVVTQRPLDVVAQLLLATVIALVLVRQLMAVAESQTLTARLADASAEQRLLIEQAPIGIGRIGADGRFESANDTLAAMLGWPADEVPGRSFLEFVHPDDRRAAFDGVDEMRRGGPGPLRLEVRGVRPEGSVVWCSTTVGRVQAPDGRMQRMVAVVEDVTERKRQAEWAATIQRQLLPETTPVVPGYELAGACRAAQDVAGDLYDWVLAEDGCLDITVADVMGKGVGAALVMAVLRTSLRSGVRGLGPAEQVRRAAASMVHGAPGQALFVTMLRARLDPASGVVRYVDAGHGHCAVRRRDGRLSRLAARSLPLGIADGDFEEGTVRLAPGDSLLVYSDGLVERGERMLDLDAFRADLDGATGALDTVERLMTRVPARPDDDITVVMLRRRPEAAPAASP